VVKAVFFDWFNTLVRYEPPREKLHSELLSEFGITVSPRDLMPGLLAADNFFYSEAKRSSLSKMSPQQQAAFYVHYGEILFREAGLSLDKNTMAQIIRRWPEMRDKMQFVLFEDVLGTLVELKQDKLILGILTNATRDAVAVQKKLGLQPYLDFIVTSEEAGVEKPDPGIFRLALEKAGVAASLAVHVGDQYDMDIVGARGVGINPVMIDRYDLSPDVKDCAHIRDLSGFRTLLLDFA
jgi:putative hydrolase of the HAD superfamily